MNKRTLLTLCAVLLFTGALAQGETIGNGPPNQSGGSDLNAFLEADNFVVSSPLFQIGLIQFWALQSAPSDFTGTVNWAFYSDAAGFPGSSLVSGNAPATGTATGNTTFGLDEYSYSLGVNVSLSTGVYWLVLHNGPSNTIPATSFYWAWSNGDAGDSASLDLVAGPPWAGNSAELAFDLTSPEPASMSLVGGSIVVAWLIRRKAKGLRG